MKQDVNQDQGQQQLNKKNAKINRYLSIIKQRQQFRLNVLEIEQYETIFKNCINDKIIDRAIGSIFGAIIGDALGAYCQFQHYIQQETLQQAMEMPGGGTFNLQPGQFTDDSQMATSMLLGLLEMDFQNPLKEQQDRLICQIGLKYLKWVSTNPFDIGLTTRKGINEIRNNEILLKNYLNGGQDRKLMQNMFRNIYKNNSNSMANGSLMRISPMACFLSLIQQNPKDHIQFIKDQIRLTHSNQLLGSAGVCWTKMLYALINRNNDEPATFRNIFHQLSNSEEGKQIKQWFQQAKKPKQKSMNAVENMGFAKIAFSYGMKIIYQLGENKMKISDTMYKSQIQWIIGRAGDTDTNAAIAGGLLGALVGFSNLNTNYVARSLKTLTRKQHQNFKKIIDEQDKQYSRVKNAPTRPEYFQPCNVLLRILQLIQKSKRYKNK